MPGDWMSVSTTPTRCPAIATCEATLAVVFDLPVPPRKEWIETILVMMPVLQVNWEGLLVACFALFANPLGSRLQIRIETTLGELLILGLALGLVNLDGQLAQLVLQVFLTFLHALDHGEECRQQFGGSILIGDSLAHDPVLRLLYAVNGKRIITLGHLPG